MWKPQIPLGAHMHAACTRGDVEHVRMLFGRVRTREEGIEVANYADFHHRVPLHAACTHGHEQVIRELLIRGADAGKKDGRGRSCADVARQNGRVGALRMLADMGVSFMGCEKVDRRGVEGRDIREGVICGNLHLVRGLVYLWGMGVNEGNCDGRTALHFAIVKGDVDMVAFLLSVGADVGCVDRRGVSPRMEAEVAGREDILAMIKGQGLSKEE